MGLWGMGFGVGFVVRDLVCGDRSRESFAVVGVCGVLWVNMGVFFVNDNRNGYCFWDSICGKVCG